MRLHFFKLYEIKAKLARLQDFALLDGKQATDIHALMQDQNTFNDFFCLFSLEQVKMQSQHKNACRFHLDIIR